MQNPPYIVGLQKELQTLSNKIDEMEKKEDIMLKTTKTTTVKPKKSTTTSKRHTTSTTMKTTATTTTTTTSKKATTTTTAKPTTTTPKPKQHTTQKHSPTRQHHTTRHATHSTIRYHTTTRRHSPTKHHSSTHSRHTERRHTTRWHTIKHHLTTETSRVNNQILKHNVPQKHSSQIPTQNTIRQNQTPSKRVYGHVTTHPNLAAALALKLGEIEINGQSLNSNRFPHTTPVAFIRPDSIGMMEKPTHKHITKMPITTVTANTATLKPFLLPPDSEIIGSTFNYSVITDISDYGNTVRPFLKEEIFDSNMPKHSVIEVASDVDIPKLDRTYDITATKADVEKLGNPVMNTSIPEDHFNQLAVIPVIHVAPDTHTEPNLDDFTFPKNNYYENLTNEFHMTNTLHNSQEFEAKKFQPEFPSITDVSYAAGYNQNKNHINTSEFSIPTKRLKPTTRGYSDVDMGTTREPETDREGPSMVDITEIKLRRKTIMNKTTLNKKSKVPKSPHKKTGVPGERIKKQPFIGVLCKALLNTSKQLLLK